MARRNADREDYELEHTLDFYEQLLTVLTRIAHALEYREYSRH